MTKLHHPNAGLLMVGSVKQTMFSLTNEITVLGRRKADIVVDDPKVSTRHAEIRQANGRFFIKDLQSTNGTLVNRKPVSEIELFDQDTIELGSCTFCFYTNRSEFKGEPEKLEKSKTGLQTQRQSTELVTTTGTIPQTILEVQVEAGPAKGKHFRFKRTHITIGRNETDLILLDPDISRQHSLIEVFGKTSVFLRDMGSTNGTFLNGTRIQVEKLQSGDKIQVGNSVLAVAFDFDSDKGGR